MKVLFQIQNIRKAYGTRVLFRDATAAFSEKQKIGVVGRNGAGKSTLFRMILGQEEFDGGDIVRAQDLRLGWIEQKNPYHAGETVIDFLLRYTEREHWDCARMAARFGLKNDALERAVDSLPGGFQMRVKLASMLLREPNFLLLDEPTNYLDLGTLLLLEEFLQNWNGGFLLITHDREFIKGVCELTLEVENGELFLFPGGLEEYLTFKDERQAQLVKASRGVEERRKELQDFVDRFRAKASKAKQAQSKMKQLAKLEKIEIGHSAGGVRISIPNVETRKGWALRLEGLAIGYPDREVAAGIDLEVRRGAKMAVLGDNGQGKTTLLKTIAGVLPALEGSMARAMAVEIAYYEQNVYSALDPAVDILTTLERFAAPGVTRQQILDMAGGFLFSGDETRKKVALLSGGERARVCLAGLLLARRSLLLLDEPTNHLDFETVEALGAALRAFSGTVLFVSHDRTFVNMVATDVLEVRAGQVSAYPGTYEDYVFHLRQELAAVQAGGSGGGGKKNGKKSGGQPVTVAVAAPAAASLGASGGGPVSHQDRKAMRAELGRLKKTAGEIEKRLAAGESERDALLAWFVEHPGEHAPDRQARLSALETGLAADEAAWLASLGQAEGLERKIAENVL